MLNPGNATVPGEKDAMDTLGPVDERTLAGVVKASIPVGRLAWALRLPSQALADAVRVAVLQAAADEARRQHFEPSAQWLMVSTAVPRALVESFLKLGPEVMLRHIVDKAADRSPHARILGLWISDPRFSKDGIPKVLPQTQHVTKEGEHSFHELVAAAHTKGTPGALLEDFVRSKTVSCKGGRVRLLKLEYGDEPDEALLSRIAVDHSQIVGQLADLFD